MPRLSFDFLVVGIPGEGSGGMESRLRLAWESIRLYQCNSAFRSFTSREANHIEDGTALGQSCSFSGRSQTVAESQASFLEDRGLEDQSRPDIAYIERESKSRGGINRVYKVRFRR